MLNNLYSIYDEKTKYYNQPIMGANDDHAKRKFIEICDHSPTIKRFKKDYKIYKVGTFDDSIGQISTVSQPSLLCEVTELYKEEKEGTNDES